MGLGRAGDDWRRSKSRSDVQKRMAQIVTNPRGEHPSRRNRSADFSCKPTLALRQEPCHNRVQCCRSERGVIARIESIYLQGTLDLLILKVLALEPQHGWGIFPSEFSKISSDVLQVQQGSLYPALHRLERRGMIKAEWATTDNNRQAKYYRLNAGWTSNTDR